MMILGLKVKKSYPFTFEDVFFNRVREFCEVTENKIDTLHPSNLPDFVFEESWLHANVRFADNWQQESSVDLIKAYCHGRALPAAYVTHMSHVAFIVYRAIAEAVEICLMKQSPIDFVINLSWCDVKDNILDFKQDIEEKLGSLYSAGYITKHQADWYASANFETETNIVPDHILSEKTSEYITIISKFMTFLSSQLKWAFSYNLETRGRNLESFHFKSLGGNLPENITKTIPSGGIRTHKKYVYKLIGPFLQDFADSIVTNLKCDSLHMYSDLANEYKPYNAEHLLREKGIFREKEISLIYCIPPTWLGIKLPIENCTDQNEMLRLVSMKQNKPLTNGIKTLSELLIEESENQ